MYHIARNSKLFSFFFVVLCLFITQYTFAEGIVNNEVLEKAMANAKPINKDELIYDIPKINTVSLADNVEKLRETYIQRQNELTQQVEDKELTVGDVFITIIIPGGLIYAGFKKNELEKTKDALLDVTTEISELSNDLIALHTQNAANKLILVQLP